MPKLSREEVEEILLPFQESQNTDLQLGILTALYAATDDDEVKQELTNSLVWLQSLRASDIMSGVSELTRGLMSAASISQEHMRVASDLVTEQFTKMQEERANAQAKSDESEQH
jgi:hypothetical protein